MNEFNLKKNGCAPFDDTMIYPFLASFDGADEIVSAIIGKKVTITDVNGIEMDHVVGKMAEGVLIDAENEKENYCIAIKKISEDYQEEVVTKIMRFLVYTLSERREEDKDVKLVAVMVDDRKGDCEALITRCNGVNPHVGPIESVYIFPNCSSKGKLKDTFHELVNGYKDKFNNEYIRDGLDWLLSEEGKDEFDSYWKSLDRRWRVNLAKELITSGMENKEVMKILNLDTSELISSMVLMKLQEHVDSIVKD